jgi:dTDP-4-dehydrorhamnose reductase
MPGIYHTAGPDVATWHQVAKQAILAYRSQMPDSSRSLEIEPIRTSDWPTPATRPAYSALSFEKVRALGILPMRNLENAMAEFAERLRILNL